MKKLEDDSSRKKLLLRIENELYKKLKEIAKNENKSLTLVINEMISEGCKYGKANASS